MTAKTTSRQIIRSAVQAGFRQPLFALLAGLAVLGLSAEAFRFGRTFWAEQHRPKQAYRRAIREGIAISLNRLERDPAGKANLPAMAIRGVLWDREENDWILFGDAAPSRRPVPIDALVLALRAARQELEAPGIDIRPSAGHSDKVPGSQKVTYFGSVERSVVGQWFFDFDYWMKRASLAQADALHPQIAPYWDSALAELEREVAGCQRAEDAHRIRCNRYWLCTQEFTAIADDDVLAFLTTPLHVSAETTGRTPASHVPSSSKGTNALDPLAAAFASEITEHLPDLNEKLPVSLIEDFAVLVAGFTWLAKVDPYRDLHHWNAFRVTAVNTPDTVSNLVLRATREHHIFRGTETVVHAHSLELSGGVVIEPHLRPIRSADDALARLHEIILKVRPSPKTLNWSFAFSP
jgi:hypothetical protein